MLTQTRIPGVRRLGQASLLAALSTTPLGAPLALADMHSPESRRVTAEHASAIALPTHGTAVGDVGFDHAIVWARSDRPAIMHALLMPQDGGRPRHARIATDAAHDFTGQLAFRGLKPDTQYRYRVWFSADDKPAPRHASQPGSWQGHFRTAPMPGTARAVRLAWGGDVAGQNVCRDSAEGFPVFSAIRTWQPDLFIGLGDMIYADGSCEATGLYGNQQVPGDFGPAADMSNYWAHWKYNRADAGLQGLLASTAYYAIWDDHEVVNDFGPLNDTRDSAPYTPGTHLMPLGLAAFLDYNPLLQRANTPKRLYRTVRWGRHLELFILDTRQYRDPNFAADIAQRPKTMLGREQLTWLKARLAASDATWKVIISSVPMSIPTGYPPSNGRDGWANYDQDTGYETELKDILRSMQQHGERNIVWLTTDVHFGEVFRYTPFPEAPGFQVHEIVSGPLNAGLFPNRSYDTDLGTESLFFFGPQSSSAVSDYQEAKRWFSYGTLAIAADGTLSAALRGTDGQVLYTLQLTPQ